MTKWIVFDTETIGLPLDYKAPASMTDNWPRIVQLAWIVMENLQPVTEKMRIIKPDGWIVPDEAAALHGITTEIATEQGIPITDALSEFETDTLAAKFVCGHNVAFDMAVVSAEFYRAQKLPPFNRPSFCTMRASTDLLQLPGKYGFKWPSLAELYKFLFNEELDGAHSAIIDAKATARCAVELWKKRLMPILKV